MLPPAELTAAFRSRGLKVTPQRQLLFRLLYANAAHPSAEALYQVAQSEMPGISRRTVYQTLNDLTTMGEVRSLSLGTGATRFDPNSSDHHHLVCDGCGVVRDVDVLGADALAPDESLAGFAIGTTHIVFRGLCADCGETT